MLQMIYKSAFSGGGHFTVADEVIVKVDLIVIAQRQTFSN